MRLFRKFRLEIVPCFASKCKKPKLRSSGWSRCTWDYEWHFVNGVRTKFWVETSWGTNAYFSYKGYWYRFPMTTKNDDDVLDFGQVYEGRDFIFEGEN